MGNHNLTQKEIDELFNEWKDAASYTTMKITARSTSGGGGVSQANMSSSAGANGSPGYYRSTGGGGGSGGWNRYNGAWQQFPDEIDEKELECIHCGMSVSEAETTQVFDNQGMKRVVVKDNRICKYCNLPVWRQG